MFVEQPLATLGLLITGFGSGNLKLTNAQSLLSPSLKYVTLKTARCLLQKKESLSCYPPNLLIPP